MTPIDTVREALERVEADLRESDRGYQALEQRLHEMEDERDRLRGAAEFAIARLEGDGDWDAMCALQDALSPTTDDRKDPSDAGEYFILTRKHTDSPSNQNRATCVWWAPNECGYVWDLNRAGRYSLEDAQEIQRSTHGDNIPVRCDEAMAAAGAHVSDSMLSEKLRELGR